MKRVLLTGMGMVGAQVTRILAEEHSVRPVALDLSFDRAYLDSVVPPDAYIPIVGSILDRTLVASVMREHGIESVIHTAAVLPMRVGHDPHPGFFEVNVAGTSNLLFTAIEAGVGRFVMFSTNGVYQFREHGVSGPVTEDYPTGLSAHNSYGNSKAVVESLIRELTGLGRIDGKILRPGEIYGPVSNRSGDDPIYWKAMVDAAVNGADFVLEGHPEHRLDWVYCKDVARAAVLLALADGTDHIEYNVSFGRPMGVYDIKTALDDLFPGNAIELRDCDTGGWDYPLSTDRLASDLGFRPAYDLLAGITDYAKWLSSVRGAES